MKKLLLASLLVFASASALASNIESNSMVCGDLKYIRNAYLLVADHGDDYVVRREKLTPESRPLISIMTSIIEGHDYDESDAPQACFFGVQSERVGTNVLNVLSLLDVAEREQVP